MGPKGEKACGYDRTSGQAPPAAPALQIVSMTYRRWPAIAVLHPGLTHESGRANVLLPKDAWHFRPLLPAYVWILWKRL